MPHWTPYCDTTVEFDGQLPLTRERILEAGQISGRVVGRYRSHSVREGLQSFDCDVYLAEPLHIHKVLPDGLNLVQIFAGQWTHRIGMREYHYRPGAPLVLGLTEAMEAIDRLPAEAQVRMAGLRIAGGLLRELSDQDRASLAPLMALQQKGPRLHRLERGHALSALLTQLYQTPYHGTLAHLHRESLALGMLVELATHLRNGTPAAVPHARSHRDLAHEARHLLDHPINDTLSAVELASQLAVSQSTLRRAFKAEFGLSMLEYVRERRLETARQLLRDGRWQVAQVAWQVGYQDPTNFAHAYKARYGHSPSQAKHTS
jgi:AraC-like DNA-binding protein